MCQEKSTRNHDNRYLVSSFRRALICVTMACVVFCQGLSSLADDTQKDSSLQIYLPREIAIQDNHLKLGQVSIVRGDESLVAKASDIALGQISMPGQKIIIDRSTLLSRLVCNGIPSSKVTLTGAEKITVIKHQQVIKGNEFVEIASSFLKKSLYLDPAGDESSASVCQVKPMRTPKDLFLPELSRELRVSPCLVKSAAANQARVKISVTAPDPVGADKEIGAREVTFSLKFNRRTAVTLVEIPAGTVIGPENVKIEKIVSDYPEPANWSPPYGLIARRDLPANTMIQPDTVGPAKPKVLIKRNETVIIKIERPGLLVTAVGKAMQQGQVDKYIKIRNLDSNRVILAKVNKDGSVEPIF